MSTHFTHTQLAVPCAAATLLLAACGSSASRPSGSTATTAATVAATGTPATAPGAPPGGGGGASTPTHAATGTYTLAGGTATRTDQAFAAARTDESAVLVKNGASLTLVNPTITTTGTTKSMDESSFYGLNAGVLAQSAARVRISGGSVTTSGSGANGVFAYGSGASVTISNARITATGQGAHGIMTSGGGTLRVINVTMSTKGASSAAIATDRGGGTVTVTGGTMTTSGFKSPGIYSTGVIRVSGAKLSATGAEAAVVEGANSISVTNTTLTGAKQHGVMLYQSMSGDASAGRGSYTMRGGSLTARVGPAFYVTNTTALITLTHGAAVHAASGVLVTADNAGTGSGNTDAGKVALSANHETLSGDLITVGTGTISANLVNHTTLTGKIATAALRLDATSTWNVTANSTLTAFTDPAISGTTITNIIGHGHTVTYAATLAANAPLGRRSYTLAGGGHLVPA
jgi:hypothetical protein